MIFFIALTAHFTLRVRFFFFNYNHLKYVIVVKLLLFYVLSGCRSILGPSVFRCQPLCYSCQEGDIVSTWHTACPANQRCWTYVKLAVFALFFWDLTNFLPDVQMYGHFIYFLACNLLFQTSNQLLKLLHICNHRNQMFVWNGIVLVTKELILNISFRIVI